jgi:hypothetical protein
MHAKKIRFHHLLKGSGGHRYAMLLRRYKLAVIFSFKAITIFTKIADLNMLKTLSVDTK